MSYMAALIMQAMNDIVQREGDDACARLVTCIAEREKRNKWLDLRDYLFCFQCLLSDESVQTMHFPAKIARLPEWPRRANKLNFTFQIGPILISIMVCGGIAPKRRPTAASLRSFSTRGSSQTICPRLIGCTG